VILAFHSIFTTYGTWLPNEPRGSWSTFVASTELYRFGKVTTVNTRRSIAGNSYDRNAKTQMQRVLKYPPVRFTGKQARTVAMAFSQTPYTLHALAVMPSHVHMVLGYTRRDIRRATGHIKSQATRALRTQGWFAAQSPWTDHGWNVYLNTDDDVRRAIDYVRENPLREGLRQQRWSFMIPYAPASAI
jgi:REP element-mobilizing transposase RayT